MHFRKEAVIPSLKEKYHDIYSSIDYGPVSTARGLMEALYAAQTLKPRKTLCVGSGNAYEAVCLLKYGFDVYTLDYHHPDIPILKGRQTIGIGQHLPFKDDTFELVFSAECIEHVPEDDIEQFMLELKRVGTLFRFTVATDDDPPYYSHLCIHDLEWWEKKFRKWGFIGTIFAPKIYNLQFPKAKGIFGVDSDKGFRFEGSKNLS